jgi:hypothetical protein
MFVIGLKETVNPDTPVVALEAAHCMKLKMITNRGS